jgi:gliding motility-associated-like protein
MFPTLRTCLLTFIALIQLCGLVQAQGDFQLIGNGGQAALGNNCFRLTQAQNTSYGAVWYRWQADLNQDFDLTADLNFGTNDFGADGIVFAFQNLCTNVGSTGGGMGIEGVNPSLFIEFDTFLNPDNGDLPDDHIGILSDGVLLHTGPTSLSAPVCALPNCGDIENGTSYTVRIFWQAAIQTLDVYFNGTLRTSYTGDIINSIFAGNSMVYWGFTSATGGFNNNHTVCITNFTDNQIQPSDTTWCANQNITFSVGNPITTVTYQWQVSTNGGATFSNVTNSAIYSGSTTPTLNLTNSPSSVIGNLYQVVISGCGGQFISDPAEITAGLLVSITQQPTNQDLCENDPATLSVTSQAATNYQWQEFIAGAWVSLTDDVAQGISGTQTSNLSLTGAATAVGSRVYRCLLWADCSAEIISNQVTINHNPGPSIQNQPINQSVCLGTNTSFSINASGPGLTYQWQMSNDGGNTFTTLVNGGVFSQTNTDSLLLSSVTAALNNALFQCVVSGDCGNPVQSTSSVLTVQNPPAFTQQPINMQACAGNSEQFISAATGSESWQWEYSNDGGVTFQNVPSVAPYNGSSSSTLTINPVAENMQGWVFRVKATGCGQELTSNNASLNLFPALTVEPIPAQVTRCEGESLQISIQAENASTYQWELNTGSGFQPLLNTIGVNGENTSNLLITNMPASWHLAKLRCKIEGECTTLFSTILILNVNGLPVLLAQPIVTPICSGSSFLLQVLSKGVGIQYQWEVLDGSGDFIPLNLTGFTGVESPDLSIASTSDMNGLILRCVLSGCDAEVKTDSIPLVILENEPVYIPNCFTPNEDQINPEFRLFTAGNPKLDASIYSRWGDLLFRWSDTNQGWDGKLNGEFVAEGMYVYKIKVETACETKNYTGRIQVIR